MDDAIWPENADCTKKHGGIKKNRSPTENNVHLIAKYRRNDKIYLDIQQI